MNLISSLRNREISNRINRYDRRTNGGNGVYVDFMLEKLCCQIEDEHVVSATDPAFESDIEVPPFALQFSTVAGEENILAMAHEEGEINLFNTNIRGENCLVKRFAAHSNAVFDLMWVHKTPQIITGSGDMTAALWDITTCTKIASFVGHQGSIKSVATLPECTSIFATGSRDGSIMIWDMRCKHKGEHNNAENVIHHAHFMEGNLSQTPKNKKQAKVNAFSQDSLNSVTGVIFQDEHNLLSSGAADGSINVWDLRRTYTFAKQKPQFTQSMKYLGNSVKNHGFSSLAFDSNRMYLYASCTDSNIYKYNCASYSSIPDNMYSGHLLQTFFVKMALSPNDEYLLSGSSDNNVYMWKVRGGGEPFLKLPGHTSEATAVAWCSADMFKIATSSDDMRIRLWRPEIDQISDDNKHLIRDKAECLRFTDEQKLEFQKKFKSTIHYECSPQLSTPYSAAKSSSLAKKTTWKVESRSPTMDKWLQKQTFSEQLSSLNSNLSTATTRGHKRKNENDENFSPEIQMFNIGLTTSNSEINNRTALSPHKDTSNIITKGASARSLHFSSEDKITKGSEANLASTSKKSDFATDDTMISSPTARLPNIVEDHCPQSKQKVKGKGKKLDWLTSYSKQCKKNCSRSRKSISYNRKSKNVTSKLTAHLL